MRILSQPLMGIVVLFLLVSSDWCLVTISFADTDIYQPPEALAPDVIDSAMTWDEAMRNVSPDCPEKIKSNQVLLDVRYLGFDGSIHAGQILVDAPLEEDIKAVFLFALEIEFPMQSVIPLSDTRFIKNGTWDDDLSMAANNTSGFNFRMKTGGTTLSSHALGCAVDINPLLNPYVKGDTVLPFGASYDTSQKGALYQDHPLVIKFKELGWAWGGDWPTVKDYQHFEKPIETILRIAPQEKLPETGGVESRIALPPL